MKTNCLINGGTFPRKNNVTIFIYIESRYGLFVRGMNKKEFIYQKILNERDQGHDLRVDLYKKIEKELNCPVISFYTSYEPTAMLEDIDVDMLERLASITDLSKGIALVINSPGGNILAADRMIKTLREYSGTRKYLAIVPKMAMSAATVACLGSSEIIMAPTSTLGPIDPQIVEYNHKTRTRERFSVFNVLTSYKKIFNKSINADAKKQNLEPYLRALESYNPKKIEEYKSYMDLSKDIAVKALQTGMLDGDSEDDILKKIDVFITPTKTKIHERYIYASDVKNCGLNVNIVDVNSKLWKLISELNMRIEISSPGTANMIETKEHPFSRPLDEEDDGDDDS